MKREVLTSGFRNVDGTGEGATLIEYLEFVDAVEPFRRIKEHSYDILDLRKGSAVLDAGCGPGFDAIRLAEKVGQSGCAYGIDSSETMIAHARACASGKDLPVSFSVGDIHALDFATGTFDAVRTERTLPLVENPLQVLGELVRVLRPGGILTSTEPDWGTMFCDPGDRDVVTRYFSFCAGMFLQGWTGRKLNGYFQGLGLSQVTVYPEPVFIKAFDTAYRVLSMDRFLPAAVDHNVLTSEEANGWMDEMQSADEKGRFSGGCLVFTVSGRKAW